MNHKHMLFGAKSSLISYSSIKLKKIVFGKISTQLHSLCKSYYKYKFFHESYSCIELYYFIAITFKYYWSFKYLQYHLPNLSS